MIDRYDFELDANLKPFEIIICLFDLFTYYFIFVDIRSTNLARPTSPSSTSYTQWMK